MTGKIFCSFCESSARGTQLTSHIWEHSKITHIKSAKMIITTTPPKRSEMHHSITEGKNGRCVSWRHFLRYVMKSYIWSWRYLNNLTIEKLWRFDGSSELPSGGSRGHFQQFLGTSHIGSFALWKVFQHFHKSAQMVSSYGLFTFFFYIIDLLIKHL